MHLDALIFEFLKSGLNSLLNSSLVMEVTLPIYSKENKCATCGKSVFCRTFARTAVRSIFTFSDQSGVDLEELRRDFLYGKPPCLSVCYNCSLDLGDEYELLTYTYSENSKEKKELKQ